MKRREFIATVSGGITALSVAPCWAGMLHRSGQNNTGYVYDERYLDYSNNPESPGRLIAIENRMKETGLSQEVAPLSLITDPLPYIRKVHSEDHIALIQDIGITGTVAELAVAGVLGAAQAVCEGQVVNAFCAIRPPGHHAVDGGNGEGFCYYNNIAIAARYIQSEYSFNKILIVDWDYHHGNSTQDCFYEDPNVLYFSTHNWHDYPETGDPALKGAGAGAGSNINVHLDPGTTDDTMKKAWEENLLSAVDAFKPEFVLISAGFDGMKNDKLGKFFLTEACFAELTEIVAAIANQYCNGRLVSMLEGGYSGEDLAKAVTAHIATLIRETSNVDYITGTTKSRTAYIHAGTLYLSSSIQDITGIIIYDVSGAVLKKIPSGKIHKNRVHLSELYLSSGSCFIEIQTAGRRPEILTFRCLE